jgi:hypothetical protein
MASFGKLTSSLVSLNNENTFALLNVNADFSLIRCDPAREYAPVGLALTSTRRKEAEGGSIHATACKLGFLFHEMLPDTPKLLEAYGTRTSEILARPGINPKGTEDDGPFRAFIGADCTSIWAAATCGPASISVLLLACILAWAWDTKQAISIWVELVEERRRRIHAQLQENKIVHPHSMAAASQDVRRSELAEWDASARSWLRRADVLMAVNHTQFRLVVNNLSIPYTNSGTTFEKVTSAWTQSMEVVERLLGNLPQQGYDRALLLAISSWHLYPDLLVFQQEAKNIPFKDKLFPPAGRLSLGLEYKGPSHNVMQWSLALSHLRYYGDPVSVRSHEDVTRIKIGQLWLIVLGAVLRQWNVSYANFDMAVGWFQDLHGVLSRLGGRPDVPELSWIFKLCSAAATVSGNDEASRDSLIRYGWRRSQGILGSGYTHMHSPFFGLCNPHVMSAMDSPTEIDCGISYLRGIAVEADLKDHEPIIVYTATSEDDRTTYTEWATAMPVKPSMAKGPGHTHNENNAISEFKQEYVRWICLHSADSVESSGLAGMLQQRRGEIEALGEVCFIAHKDSIPKFQKERSTMYRWADPPPIFGDGEFAEFSGMRSTRGIFTQSAPFKMCVLTGGSNYKKHQPYADHHNSVERAANTLAPLDQGRIFLSRMMPPIRVIRYLKESLNTRVRLLFHNLNLQSFQGKQLLMLSDNLQPRTESLLPSLTSDSRVPTLKRKAPMDDGTAIESHSGQEAMKRRPIWITGDPNHPYNDAVGCFNLMSGACQRSLKWLIPLRILELAQALYEQIPQATVSLRLAEQDLNKTKWLPDSMRSIVESSSEVESFLTASQTPTTDFIKDMTRPKSFACIAMFESGHFNVDPEQLGEVLALCSEDSIFVAGVLLSDPGVETHGSCIRQLVGNIGHSGMVFMVPPLDPRVRPLGHNLQLVEHRPYQQHAPAVDSFSGTSMHLSFTTWKMPLDWQNTGEIDQEMFLLESVIAVQDNGKWVADIDVVELEKSRPDVIESFGCDRDCAAELAKPKIQEAIVSIDGWEELLDPPPCIGEFRAKGNWVARLAVASILCQQDKGHHAVIIGPEKVCWRCFKRIYEEPEPHFPQIVIY